MKVYEAVARAILDEGTRTAFSLLGDANMELVASLRALGLADIRQSRHESATVAEAEGYARASGTPAVCSVTCGPGLANALLSLTSAVRSRAPIVLVTGAPSRDDSTNLQRFDHHGVAKLAGAAYQTVGSPDAVLDAVRSAFRTARTGSIPVVLDVDIDIQNSDYPWDYAYEPSTVGLTPRQRPWPDELVLRAAVERLRAAERPVVLAGEGAVAAGAADALRALAERAGALLAVTLPARGLFHPDPFNIGVAGLFSSPVAGELLAEADCVVAVGASLNYFTTEGGYLFPNAAVIQVDVASQVTMSTGRSADVYLLADARVGAEKLLEALRGDPPRTGYRTPEVARMIRDRPIDASTPELEPGTADPREVCEELERRLPEVAGLVIGGGHFWAFPIMHMARRYEPQLFGYHFGAIGQGLPLALGAAAARPDRPVVLVEGDGSLLMNAGELEGLARRGTRVLALILNDQAYGAEFHKLRAKGFEPDLGANPPTDIAAVARAFGCPGAVITDAKELGPLVDEFLAGTGPMLIDCRISRNVISAPYRRMHFGLEH
ncbi:thiamine pyrophosphate-binding protein [Frankia sp. CNm7]|uniref:Thiamine pyrophosphate-binding protein n=1 Tax=Frankia nepalensis TaxID=1836974 RepID=A0A937US57_9ACTN|nr:thiamine pyrophosphate-binding protein [Frankia nepalensis]MBL7499160.1 thiamine pyrophosphate-binding protein [Frankia nepalensis]MBL7511022.1 thiamine pyrophosphate-binding protein [Frankia nepalensis]MBL7520510.1 thiamine pyrophosphate-binding protein [Frankia nepalensis]MBL7632102.1 thiamine pyrophosphate-binding protein [Frankia nepalensis]